jgi:peptidoglycan/xylan/chitin deacetylase (PgdA/CDA1 family)
MRSLWNKVRSRLRPRRPRPAILMYHRVASVRHDPWGLAVDPGRFEAQIAYLKTRRTPMSMSEMVNRLRTKTLPANAVAITFDDGYRDNLVHAKPVLLKYGVPATLFLTTGCVDAESPFWWDELAAMILESARATRQIEICAGETIALEWGPPEPSDTGTWRAGYGAQTQRQHCFLAIWSTLQRTTALERDRVMRSLRQSFGTVSDPLAMPMSSGEVREWSSGGALTLGAHTITHPALTRLSRSESRREIRESAEVCRRLSGEPSDGFAYPYGDTNSETRADVVLAGLEWACTTRGAFADAVPLDFHALPRLAVPDAGVPQLMTIMSR